MVSLSAHLKLGARFDQFWKGFWSESCIMKNWLARLILVFLCHFSMSTRPGQSTTQKFFLLNKHLRALKIGQYTVSTKTAEYIYNTWNTVTVTCAVQYSPRQCTGAIGLNNFYKDFWCLEVEKPTFSPKLANYLKYKMKRHVDTLRW